MFVFMEEIIKEKYTHIRKKKPPTKSSFSGVILFKTWNELEEGEEEEKEATEVQSEVVGIV